MTRNIATVARDIGVSAYDLDAFVYNDGDLPETALHKLTDYAFSGLMRLDLATDTLTTRPQAEAVPMNPGPLPGEYESKPKLSKSERRPKMGPQLERAAQWDPKLDKLWRHRAESRGPLG